MTEYRDRHDLIQRLSPGYGVEPKGFNKILIAVIAISMGVCILAVVDKCVPPPPMSVNARECSECHRRMAMVEYFKKAKNPTPEEMAEAVINPQVKSGRLMAAIAVKGEKNTPYTIRRGGFRGQHAGAYQMNERLHKKKYGPVPHDPLGQTLQAEKYLSDLTQEYPIKKALSIYGGDSSDNYQRRVLAELVRVP